MNILWGFFRWYDRLREPWRFFVFLLLVMPMLATFLYGSDYFGVVAISHLGLLTLTRIFYVEFWRGRAR